MTSWFLWLGSSAGTLLGLLLLLALGWLVMWKLFLSDINCLRELLGLRTVPKRPDFSYKRHPSFEEMIAKGQQRHLTNRRNT